MNPCVEGVLTLKRNGNVCPKRLGTTVPRHAGLSSIHCWRVLPESVCEGQFGCVPILGGGEAGHSVSQPDSSSHAHHTHHADRSNPPQLGEGLALVDGAPVQLGQLRDLCE